MASKKFVELDKGCFVNKSRIIRVSAEEEFVHVEYEVNKEISFIKFYLPSADESLKEAERIISECEE